MSTELEQRLARLAPEVDVDAGREAMRARRARSRRHRSLFAGSSVLVVAAGLVVLLAAPWHDDRGQPVRVVVTPSTADLGGAVPIVRARNGGIELAVAAPSEAIAGTRVRFVAVVRNIGATDVWWQAGGCGIPVEGSAGPATGFPINHLVSVPKVPNEWDPASSDLVNWLAAHKEQTQQRIQRDDNTGQRAVGCNDDSRMRPVHPGEHLTYRGSFEARVGAGALADHGNWNLNVSFTGYAKPGDYIEHPLSPVTARAPITVLDDTNRVEPEAAFIAFQHDARLQPWLDSTVVADRPDLTQTYATDFSWWRGAWELWIWPHWQGVRGLRMRYDPVQHKVVDVRTVYLGRAPADEPGAAADPNTPDQVIPPRR